MATEQVSVAALTAVVGYDLLRDATIRQSGGQRRLVAAGLAGSAAVNDTRVRLMAGERQVGILYNSHTGAVVRESMFRLAAVVYPNEELHAVVEDAPATNPINLAVDVE